MQVTGSLTALLKPAAALAGALSFVTVGAASAQAVSWDATLTLDALANVAGGVETGASGLHKAEAGVTLDAGALWGLEGVTLRGAAMAAGGGAFSEPYVGDAQAVSNIETDDTLRVSELWVEWAPAFARFKLGVIDLNSEFDANDVGALFINSSHGIGPDLSQIGPNGPSIFPVTGWGAVAEAALSETVTAAVGLFDGEPGDLNEPEQASLSLSGRSSLTVGELRVQGPVRLTFGAWRHDGAFSDVRDPALEEGAASGVYGLAQASLHRSSAAEWSGFARIGAAEADRNALAGYVGLGLRRDGAVFAGALNGAGDESLGLAIAHAVASQAWRDAQSALGQATKAAETAIELTYRLQASAYMALQPTLKYIIAPSARADLDDALVVGLRLEFTAP